MKPIKKILLHDAVVSEIIGYIKNNNLKQGDKLPTERNLSVFLGVSRPIIREALKILEVNNIIIIKHGSGIFLNSINNFFFNKYEQNTSQKEILNRLKQLAETRLMIETFSAIEASKVITPEQIKELYEHEEQENLILQSESYKKENTPYVNLNFEIMITKIYGNPFVMDFHKNINDLWKMQYEALGSNSYPLEIRHADHMKILLAIESGEKKKIEKSVREHIIKVIDSCEKLL